VPSVPTVKVYVINAADINANEWKLGVKSLEKNYRKALPKNPSPRLYKTFKKTLSEKKIEVQQLVPSRKKKFEKAFLNFWKLWTKVDKK
jgi:hypothetical protein